MASTACQTRRVDETDARSRAEQVLTAQGIQDNLVAVGWFYPRGHTAAGFAGGLVGGGIGDELGSAAGGVGTVGGYVAGTHAADAASGLPERTIVAVSATHVYLLASHHEGGTAPTELFATLLRENMETKVHQRVNVRVLEIIDRASGAKYELEGSRVPMTHSEDVIKALR